MVVQSIVCKTLVQLEHRSLRNHPVINAGLRNAGEELNPCRGPWTGLQYITVGSKGSNNNLDNAFLGSMLEHIQALSST